MVLELVSSVYIFSQIKLFWDKSYGVSKIHYYLIKILKQTHGLTHQIKIIYRVTQNKVHHLLAILYLIFEVNITQVSYVV